MEPGGRRASRQNLCPGCLCVTQEAGVYYEKTGILGTAEGLPAPSGSASGRRQVQPDLADGTAVGCGCDTFHCRKNAVFL